MDISWMKQKALDLASRAYTPLMGLGKTLYQTGAKLERYREWAVPPRPKWVKHESTLALFDRERVPHFWERGVYASELAGDKRVLELCSGDGSIAALFLAPVAKEVIGVDLDEGAVHYANSRWKEIQNCRFETQDVKNLSFPSSAFDLINWDASIGHFTDAELSSVFSKLAEILKEGGIIQGSTVKKSDQHGDQSYRYESLSELETFLKKHFSKVRVWERPHSDRITFYFRCTP